MFIERNSGIRRNRFLWLFLVLFALPWLSPRAEAQQLQKAPKNDTNIAWVAVPTAQTRLLAQIQTLQGQMASMAPGTSQYTDRYRRVIYYKAVYRDLQQGQTVPQALENAVVPAATLGGQKEAAFTTKAELQALYAEGIVLLTN